MTVIKYNEYSPYVYTQQVTQYVDYLDFWNPIVIPASPDDLMISIDPKYSRRPDLLAFDLYGTPQLWWVFAARNPDVIKDPIYDFRTNAVIYAPTKDSVGVYL